MLKWQLITALLLGNVVFPAQGALFDRGNGMIYDDVLNITWLQNANQGGSMNWNDSVAWADSLVHGGFDDWRLASMDVNLDDTIADCNGATELACRDNELGYMYYYNFGGIFFDNFSGNPTSVDGITFSNVTFVHWSGTEFAPGPANAWNFSLGSGLQGPNFKLNSSGAWAVRSGDVAVIPLPAGVWLLASGLLGLSGLRRGRRRR